MSKNSVKENFKIKKYKQTFTILVLLLLSQYLLKINGFGSWKESGLVLAVWIFGIVFLIRSLLDKHFDKYAKRSSKINDAQLQVNSLGTPTKKTLCLERNGHLVIGKITNVELVYLTYPPLRVFFIDYVYENQKGDKMFGLKEFDNNLYDFDPRDPKINDLVEVLFDVDNPCDSVLRHREAKQVKWYQLQKKFSIKILDGVQE